jgi:hypothetical protein
MLYYQAELTTLEYEYRQLEKKNGDREDEETSNTAQLETELDPASRAGPAIIREQRKRDNKCKCSTSWWALAEWHNRTDGEKEQWARFLRIRQVLEKYSTQNTPTEPTFS